MNANELSPTISTGTLSRVRGILKQLEVSGSLLDLARPEVKEVLTKIDEENQDWTVLVDAQAH